MSGDSHLRDTYPELLGDGSDPRLERVVRALHGAYSSPRRPRETATDARWALDKHAAVLGRDLRGTARPRRGHPAFGGSLAAAGIGAVTVLAVVAAVFFLSRAKEQPRANRSIAARLTPTSTKAARPARVPSLDPTSVPIGADATATPEPTATPLARPTASRAVGRGGGVIAAVLQGSLWVMNPDGSRLTNLMQDYDPNRGVFGPAWSPDGKRIAYTDLEEEPNEHGDYSADIFVMNADGSGRTRLVGAPHSQGGPEWSPDGKRIAYTESRPSGPSGAFSHPEVWVVNADGSGRKLLARDAHSPSWSPDGGSIAFAAPEKGIHVMRADGTGRTRLAGTADGDVGPKWSPDGARIAVIRAKRPGEAFGALYVVGADGRGARELVADHVRSASWSPDGRRLVYVGVERENGLSVIGADGSGRTPLLSGTAAAGARPDSSPDWSPSGVTIPRYAGPAPEATRDSADLDDGDQQLKLGGVVYRALEAETVPQEVGPVYATTTRRAPLDPADPEGERLRDGDSTYQPAGSKLYRLHGYQPRFRLAAYDPHREGHLFEYWAVDPRTFMRTGADLYDLRGKVARVTVADLSEERRRLELEGVVGDRGRVGRLVEMLLAAPVQPDPDKGNEHWYLRVVYELENGVQVEPEHFYVRLPPEYWRTLEEALRQG